MKSVLIAAFAATMIATPVAAQTVTYDANPTVAFTYGAGNNYTPANAVDLTTTSDISTAPITSELSVRAHTPGQPANATGGTGVYTFNLGSAVSFDYSFFGTATTGATVGVTNLLTGDTASFNAALFGSPNTSSAVQGSQQLGFGFLNGGFGGAFGDINFDANQNNTFRIDLNGGGQTLSAFAQIGNGGANAVGAVPEPATWAMMLFGFGAMGVSVRRQRRTNNLLQAA
jgi:PEP-CTERM motif